MSTGKTKPQYYKDLVVWQRGMDLVVMCYRLTPTSRRLKEWDCRFKSENLQSRSHLT
jgi:hypothetical protein